MQNVPQWIQSLIEISKLNERHLKNLERYVLWGVIIFLGYMTVSGKDSDCDKVNKGLSENYKRLGENYNILKAEVIYLSKGKADCYKSKDTIYDLYFGVKKENQDLKNQISILKNK